MNNPFESPLRIKVDTEFSAFRFGSVMLEPEITDLQQLLNTTLLQTFETLPESLLTETCSILGNYSGNSGNFYHLFYVPIWSFLHWIPAKFPDAFTSECLQLIRIAHALSLFIHLWDDHLCDHQLEVDLLRLQIRTLAWQRFISASEQLCQNFQVHHDLLHEHIQAYLNSLHIPQPVSDLNTYCCRFIQQISIWMLVPRLLGYAIANPAAAQALEQIIESFAIAWRLLDDLQDIYLDVQNNETTAVWLELDETGRNFWAMGQSSSRELGKPSAQTWQLLSENIHDSGCLERLLSRIEQNLQRAIDVAQYQGWEDIGHEISQCCQGWLADKR